MERLHGETSIGKIQELTEAKKAKKTEEDEKGYVNKNKETK